MVTVVISGMPAVGKTTVAKALAQRLGLKYYCGGDALKELALEMGFKPKGDDWWDTEEGMKFLQERKENPDFDKAVDRRLSDVAKEGDVVISSYPLPWLLKEGVKFWLKASQETRAKRMAERDRIAFEEALKIVKRRDDENRTLYKKLYGIRFGDDLSVFDFVINTDILSKDGVADVVTTIVKHLR